MFYPVVFFIILFLFLLLLIFFIRIRVLLEYIRNNNEDHIVVSVFLFSGLIKYKYEAPFLDLMNRGLRLRKIKKAGKDEILKDRDKGLLNFNEIIEIIKSMKETYEANKKIISKISRFLKKRLIIIELNLDIEYGTGDAGLTGILYGVIWSFVGNFVSFLFNNFRHKKEKINIKADFSIKKFNMDLYCIISIKLVHIIVVAVKYALHIFVSKLKSKTFRVQKYSHKFL